MSYEVPDPPQPKPCHESHKHLKIEAVITCVNYADFLAYTLPLNKCHFDKIVVVTSPGDEATERVCATWDVECLATDAFNTRWGQFKKGSGINEGLKKLDRDAWMLHLDSDIVLPGHFRAALRRADLDPTFIYGVDRAEFKSYEEWQRYLGNPEPPIQGNGFFIHTEHTGRPLGTRIGFNHCGGYIPIGFFQLWHAESGITRYPEGHTDAGREDANFPTQWPRRKRALIPEIIVYHLESEPAEMAVNWKGRKSKKFGIHG